MASQLLGIKTRFTNDLGSPLVGGQVYTYFAGTSTNQDSYSDAELTVPNTNPVILDDTGSADIFLKGAYRIRVFDKSGRFIEEQDNVTQAASQGDTTDLTIKISAVESDLVTANTELNKVKLDTGITATAKFGGIIRDLAEKLSESISLKDQGAIGDATTDDSAAVLQAASLDLPQDIDGNNFVYSVDALPTDYSKFSKASFKNDDDQEYPTEDMYDIELSQITKTPNFTGWAEHKSFVHNDVIYVPVDIATEDAFDHKKIGWIKSFDGGASWTSPELLMELHPDTSYGWNTFSAGVINNRFVMLLEERINSDRSLNDLIIHDRILGFSAKYNNPVSLTSGSSIATVTIAKNGLVVGDTLFFSGMQGDGVAGLSGNLKVKSIIDENTFTVDKLTVSTVTTSATGGTPLIAATFYNNTWRKTSLGKLPDANGNAITHAHSLTVRDSAAGRLFAGFHNGSGTREVGFLDITNFWQTPTSTKRRLPSEFEEAQGEPSVLYHNGKTYLSTRGQSTDPSLGAVLCVSNNDGGSWSCKRIPDGLHYDNTPMVIHNDTLYIFTSERRPNEFDTSEINHYQRGRTRSFMLTMPLAEADVLDFTNFRKVLLGYGIYSGELQGSACGVGSALAYKDDLFYFVGGENYAIATRFSLNTYSVSNEYLADSYQPDLYAYRIPLANRLAGLHRPTVRCPDNRNDTVYRFENKLYAYSPLVYQAKITYKNGLQVASGDLEFARYIKGLNSSFNGVLNNTSTGGDTSSMFLAGGGALSSSRGSMIAVFGANHPSTPDEIHLASSSTMRPINDGVVSLGKSTNRFKDIYSVNAVTSTSDGNLKSIEGAPNDALIQPLLNIAKNIKVFKWKDGGNRKHIGVIAQEVYAEFETAGIDAFDYGFIGKDLAYDDVVTGQDDDGQDIVERQPRLDADGNHVEIWNVRHGELQYAILWAQIQKLKELI